MRAEGTGGRGCGNTDYLDARVLDGLLGSSQSHAGAHARECANPDCRREFTSRQDGDDYCSEQCDPLSSEEG